MRRKRKVPAGCRWNPGRRSVRTRSYAYRCPSRSVPWLGIRYAGVLSTDHSPRRGSSTTTGSSSSPIAAGQTLDNTVSHQLIPVVFGIVPAGKGGRNGEPVQVGQVHVEQD